VNDGRPIGEDDLQAYIDGHAGARREAVEAHLAGRPELAARVAEDLAHRSALRSALAGKADEPIPSRLRIAAIQERRRGGAARYARSIAAALGWLAIGLGAGWVANEQWQERSPANLAAPAITAYRTYSVEKIHAVEVPAAQEAHLVQWLSRRVGKPLTAPDLSAQGYALMGGRLVPAGAAPAALFMYDDGKGSRLTLYVTASDHEGETAFRFEKEGDVAAFFWIDNGLSYVVTGQAERSKLLSVAEAVFRQI
jgi:anti-sigma factor RsiW